MTTILYERLFPLAVRRANFVLSKTKKMKKIQTYRIGIPAMLFFLILSLASQAQRIHWKDYFITGSSMFAAGMLDGTTESISYHYENGFRPHFKNINDDFWNPAISWKNKYKGGLAENGPRFTGSTTTFAWTTDAYHLLRTSRRMIYTGTLAYYVNANTNQKAEHLTKKQIAKKAVIDFVFLTAVRSAGFTLTYSCIFRPKTATCF
jgi:hypothetical protein